MSEAFASGVDDPFALAHCHIGEAELPLLDGSVAHIICTPWGVYEAGDHTVFFGRVTGGQAFERQPLVHYRSGYTSTQQPD